MKDRLFRRMFMVLMLLIAVIATGGLMIGCAGDDGAAGPAGPAGPAGVDAAAVAKPESCIICHEGQGAVGHQAIYNDYVDTTLAITIDSVVSVASATPGQFNTTITFTVRKNGQPYTLTGSNNFRSEFDQETVYTVLYSSAARTFGEPKNFLPATSTIPTSLGNGQFSITGTGLTYAPESSNALVFIYVAKGRLNTEGMALYADVANIGREFGDVDTYASTANVSGCEKCHGAPYRKHGYRMATVSDLPPMAACKPCHYDNRNGGHEAWQLLVDDVARYAELQAQADATPATNDSADSLMTAAENAKYAYTANVMNDTHMTHAMEFAYPQDMANCVTCHANKLNLILTDANFNLTTCRSCHPVTGTGGTDPKKAPALRTIMPALHGATMLDNLYADGAPDPTCTGACHAAGGIAPVFSTIHTGYNSMIYSGTSGSMFADIFKASIDGASFNAVSSVLTITFSAAESPDIAGLAAANISPTVMVGLYGYDTKDFIVGSHGRSIDDNHDGVINSSDSRDLEWVVGTTHPRFTLVSAPADTSATTGTWVVTANLSAWVSRITDSSVKRVEIGVMPKLTQAGVTLALNAPSRTFDLTTNAFNDTFYSPIVKVPGCNACHEALGTTFHSGDRGGNIVVCRLCHTIASGGSHLELQSRSIDSYVHAIHSFQPFDIGDIDFTNPEETLHLQHHLESAFPNFTIKNCEACHTTAGVYETPSQTKSLPGILSGTDYVEGRNINNVPPYVSGPATRACGGCHRAVFVNEDDENGLASFNEHTKTNGYLIPDGTGVLDSVIKTIMSYFD